MQLSKKLGDFNRRMSDELRGTFSSEVESFESHDGALLFRGPIQGHKDPQHIGTHVAVSLEEDVRAAMEEALPAEREEMIQIFLNSLGSQVIIKYDPKNIGPYALDVVGTMRTLRG